MYEKFFNLRRTPFSMVPDSDCVHLTGQHADVISGAVFGILERRGCLVLTGEAGLGKTTALRAVAELLSESNAYTSLISHPTLDASEFLELAMLNFGMQDVPISKAQRIKALEHFLVTADAAGKVCVLIVDEAHKLTPEALEEVRLLGNFESGNHKLLQILLAGQNELNTRLDLPELWQLKQRVAFRLSLTPLTRDGVDAYISFRWTKAGGDAPPFNKEALDAIAAWSLGIPRVINAICDNSLLLALSDAVRTIGVDLIQEVCLDLRLDTPPLPRKIIELPEQKTVQPPVPAAADADHPVLVRKAAVGSTVPQEAPLPPVESLSKTPSAFDSRKKFKGQKLAVAKPSPEPLGEPAPVHTTWSDARPSLLKKWLGLRGGQSTSARKHTDLISLKHHL